MSDMLERATAAVLPIINTDQAHIVAARSARAALLAALDPEDEALQQLWGDVIDRFSDPASHHCMATFFAELKAMAQGVSGGNEQTVEKD